MKPLSALFLSSLFACADHATIGALCPVDCQPRPKDGICDCSPPRPSGGDAAVCQGDDCLTDAASAPCTAADCTDAGSGMTCNAGTLPLLRAGLDLMVVIDDGASVAPWYTQMAEGFRAFINEDASQGVAVGLQRFGESCNPPDYLPPMVQIAPLPDNLAALEAAIPITALSTNSTVPAIDAAEQYAQRWASDHPETHVAVLLLTDASPGACDGLTGNYDVEAARLARAAHLSNPSIKTYVVAAGSFEVAGAIALAGGTELQRLPITATSEDVLTALRVVRGAARSCELAWPDGSTLTADTKVVVTGANGAESFGIAEDSACDQPGFFLSDLSGTRVLFACPQTCGVLDAATQIELSGACNR